MPRNLAPAQAAVVIFDGSSGDDYDDDPESLFTDLLTDLLLLAKEDGLDPAVLHDRMWLHYSAEGDDNEPA